MAFFCFVQVSLVVVVSLLLLLFVLVFEKRLLYSFGYAPAPCYRCHPLTMAGRTPGVQSKGPGDVVQPEGGKERPPTGAPPVWIPSAERPGESPSTCTTRDF